MTSTTIPFEPIERLEEFELLDVQRRFLEPGKPVVLVGGTRGWPAHASWNVEYLTQLAGHRPVTARLIRDRTFQTDPDRGYLGRKVTLTFGELLDSFSAVGFRKEYYYMGGTNLMAREGSGEPVELPELAGDVAVPELWRQDRPLERSTLWISRGEPSSPLHFDRFDNFLVMVRGSKTVYLLPPGEARHLSPHPHSSVLPHMSSLDLQQPDLQKHPRSSRLRGFRADIAETDLLFIPAYWWHQVQSYGLNIAVNFWFATRFPFRSLFFCRSFAYYWTMYCGSQLNRRLPFTRRLYVNNHFVG